MGIINYGKVAKMHEHWWGTSNFGGYWDPTSEKRVIDLMHVSQKGW